MQTPIAQSRSVAAPIDRPIEVGGGANAGGLNPFTFAGPGIGITIIMAIAEHELNKQPGSHGAAMAPALINLPNLGNLIIATGTTILLAKSEGKDYVFPDPKELAKELGIPESGIHDTKDDILGDRKVKELLKAKNIKNPDIGFDASDRKIVLKDPRNPTKTIKTDLDIDLFKQ